MSSSSPLRHWCAIGDSFTYLNDHLNETAYRLGKGYLSRTETHLKFPVKRTNLGINGSATDDWLSASLVTADFYTILLGTNDWFSRQMPRGTADDFTASRKGTILGNMGILIDRIRALAPAAPIFVMNPVERGDFVYVNDNQNHSHGSYLPVNGQTLEEVAEAIFTTVRGEGIIPINLHDRSGFTVANAVLYKRVQDRGRLLDLPFPDYCNYEFHVGVDPYPYPLDAINYTYDGLHPSDKGCEIIALILADEINRYFA